MIDISDAAKRVAIDELGALVDRLHRQAEMMEERYGLNGEIPRRDRAAADLISTLRKGLQRDFI